MAILSTPTIQLDYTPTLTKEKISKVLALHFPEYKQVWPWLNGEGVALKKRSHALACVSIEHKPKKNQTNIYVYGGMSPWSMMYAGILWHKIAIGDLVEQVEEVIRKEIPTLISK